MAKDKAKSKSNRVGPRDDEDKEFPDDASRHRVDRKSFQPAFPGRTSALDLLSNDSMLRIIGLCQVEGGWDAEPGG